MPMSHAEEQEALALAADMNGDEEEDEDDNNGVSPSQQEDGGQEAQRPSDL